METYPSVLRAAVVVLASDIAVLRTAVLGIDLRERTRSKGKDSDSSELHYDYYDPVTNDFVRKRMYAGQERVQKGTHKPSEQLSYIDIFLDDPVLLLPLIPCMSNQAHVLASLRALNGCVVRPYRPRDDTLQGWSSDLVRFHT